MEVNTEQLIRTTIEKYTGVQINDPDTNLLCPEYNINPAYFMYVFNELEKELGSSVYKVFEIYGKEVMTVRNLCNAISKTNSERHIQ